MKNDVNLIPKKNISPSRIARIRLLRYSSMMVLFLIAVLSMTLFFLIAFSPLPALQEQEKEEIGNITAYHSKIAKLLLTKNRLSYITTTTNNRSKFDTVIEMIQQQLSQSVTIDAFHVKNKSVTVRVASLSLQDLNTFLDLISEKQQKKEAIRTVKLLGITLNDTQQHYAMTVELSLL